MSEILALMSALCWGSTGVLLRAVREKSRFSFMLPEGLISIIVVVLFISILGVWSDFIDLPFNLIALMILAAFFNILGTLSYVKAMSKLKIGLVLTIITSSFILSTVFATQWILNDPVSSFVVVSAILIISGVIFINFNTGYINLYILYLIGISYTYYFYNKMNYYIFYMIIPMMNK